MELENSKDYAKVYTAHNFIEKGVCEYANERVYLDTEVLCKAINTMKGRPVVIDHVSGLTPENMQQYAVGYVVGAECSVDGQTALDCKFVVFDEEAKGLIANGYSVSCAYKPTSYGPGGTWHNVPYDRQITDLEFTHLALVADPRYEDAKIYENSKGDNMADKGRWITVKGTHVFVKEGQAVEDAMKETFKGKSSDGDNKLKGDIGKAIGHYRVTSEDVARQLGVSQKSVAKHLDNMVKSGDVEYDKKTDTYRRLQKSEVKKEDLKGKYMRDDVEFDEDQALKDIEKAKSIGYKGIDDISEFLGLDPDEYMALTGESYSDDDEEPEKSVKGKKKDEGSRKDPSKVWSEKYKSKVDDIRKKSDAMQTKIEELNKKLQATKDAKKGELILKQMYTLVKQKDALGKEGSKLYADWYKESFDNEKHNSKEDYMKIEEFFNKMGEVIEEKLNACKRNEMDEEDEDDDDKFELDGETYSKKELVNAFKEKKNAEDEDEKEKEKENEDEDDEDKEKEDDEKQNSKDDEFFNAMEKRIAQQNESSDKIEIYTQAKGLERGKKIYG